MSEKFTGSPLRPGSVKGPVDNQRRDDLQRKPQEVVLDVKEEHSETKKEEVKKEQTVADVKIELETLMGKSRRALTPEDKAKLYDAGLELAGVSKDKAREIQDSMVYNNCYEEEYVLGGGKLRVTLRTRVYRDVERALRFAEAEAPRMPLHVDDLLCRYNLAASLAKYNDTTFEFPATGKKEIEAAFDARYEFVMNLATPLAGRLNSCLMEFDAMMNAVLADGGPENF
jgi:hypothetical protein